MKKISCVSLVWLLLFSALVTQGGTFSAFADQSVPLPPRNLNATAASGTQIYLVWNPPINATQSGVTSYKIEISPSCTGNFSLLANTTATIFVSNSLTNGTCYQFRVDAVNTAGFSIPSNVASTNTLSAPSAPSGLAALVISSSQINLSWTASNNGGTPIRGYKIERETSCTGNFVTIADTVNANTVYSDAGLSANTCYLYRISAINEIGTSHVSNNATATTTPAPVQNHVPGAPTGLGITTVSDKSLAMSWTAPSDNGGSKITNYLIQRNGTILSFTFSNATSFVDKHLLPSHQQTYRVAAWNSFGLGPFSGSISGSTNSSGMPSTTGGGQSSNSTGNLGQAVSDFIHNRNQILQEERQNTINLIHECHTQIKNATVQDGKQIREDCKVKINAVKEKYKELRKQLQIQLMKLKSSFKSQHNEDKNEAQTPKEIRHLENGTKNSENKSETQIQKEIHSFNNAIKHSEDKSKDHGKKSSHGKKGHNDE